jgi:hypothetical protein
MVLEASRFAFERDPNNADLIHNNAVRAIRNIGSTVRERKISPKKGQKRKC